MSSGINILIDEIEAIAQQTRGQIREDAEQGATTFANVTLDVGAFNGIPPGLAFHTQQQAAHQVFVETINGVVADLEQFGETLAANAASHRAVDESNADTLTAMEARRADEQAAAAAMSQVNEQYAGADQGEGLESQEAYDEERTGNEALDVDTEQDSGAEPGPDGQDSGQDSGLEAPPAGAADQSQQAPSSDTPGSDPGASSSSAFDR